MPSYYEQLGAEETALTTLSTLGGAEGFFGQEGLRFLSIAGSLLVSPYKLDETATNDERYLTHVLARSLSENFFAILYLFDEPTQTAARYDLLINAFKNDYRKLIDDDLTLPILQPQMQQYIPLLEPANPAWKKLPVLPNVKDMLKQATTANGVSLDYLYFVYRITSFDTHARSLGTIFNDVFGKTCNFPVLKLKEVFELMAEEYLAMVKARRVNGVI